MRAEQKYPSRRRSNARARAIFVCVIVLGGLFAFYLYDRQTSADAEGPRQLTPAADNPLTDNREPGPAQAAPPDDPVRQMR